MLKNETMKKVLKMRFSSDDFRVRLSKEKIIRSMVFSINFKWFKNLSKRTLKKEKRKKKQRAKDVDERFLRGVENVLKNMVPEIVPAFSLLYS